MTTKWTTPILAAILFSLIAGTGLAGETAEGAFSLTPLRDPFWPVGYFPDHWQTENPTENQPSATSGSDWEAPAAQISVTGTSRMGSKAVAIINGDLKEEGDLIEVSYSGRIYQWKLQKINAGGTIDIERVGISNAGVGFHPGDKK